MIESARAVEAAFDEHAHAFAQRLESAHAELAVSASAAEAAFDERARAFAEQIEATQTALVERASAVEATLEERTRALAAQIENAHGQLALGAADAEAAFDARAKTFVEHVETSQAEMLERAAAIESSLDDHAKAIAERLESAQAELAVGASVAEAAFEEHARAFVERLEAGQAELLERAGAVDARFDERAAAIAERIEHGQGALLQTIGAAEAMLDERARGFAERIEAGHTELLERAGVVDASFDERAAAIAERIENGQNILLQSVGAAEAMLDERTRALSERIETRHAELLERASAVETSFDERAASISERIENGQNALLQSVGAAEATLDERARILAERVEAGQNTLLQSVGAAEALLDERAREFAKHIEAKRIDLIGCIVEVETSLDERTRGVLTQWSDSANSAADKLTFAATEAVAAIAASSDNLNEALVSRLAAFEDALGSQGTDVVRAFSEQTGRFDESLRRLDELVGVNGETVIDRIGLHAAAVSDDIARHVESVDTIFGGRREELEQRLQDHFTRVDEVARRHIEDIENAAIAQHTALDLVLANHQTRVENTFDGAMANMDDLLVRRGQETGDKIESGAQQLAAALDGKFAQFEETVGAGASAVEQRLAKRVQEMSTAIEAGIEITNIKSSDRLREISGALEALAARIDESLDKRGKLVGEALARQTLAVARTLSEGGRGIAEDMDAKSQLIAETLQSRAKTISESFDLFVEGVDSSLRGRMDEMKQVLGGSAQHFEEEILAPLQKVGGRIETSGAELSQALASHRKTLDGVVASHGQAIQVTFAEGARAFDSRIGALADSFRKEVAAAIAGLEVALEERGGDVTGAISRKILELRALINAEGGQFIADLNARGETISNNIVGAGGQALQSFEQRVSAMVALLTRRGDDLLAAINAGSTESVRALSNLTGSLTEEVETSTSTLRNLVETSVETMRNTVGASTDALRATVETNVRASVTTMTSNGDRLRGEMATLLERLGQTLGALDHVVGEAGSRLGAIEGGLDGRMEDLHKALGAMAAQVTELDRLSADTRNGSMELVERLATHASAFADVSRDLTAKQQTIDFALQHRQKSLENLLTQLDDRSRGIQGQIAQFVQEIEGQLDTAQARAQEVGSSLANVTKGAANSVAGQFEMIRDSANRERERTQQMLQGTYDQANKQVSQMLEDGAKRFQQMLADVRQMAGDVQRELDETRQEMKRGVLELPKETSDAANAMRRVVSDQIRALKELAAVVTSSGGTFDVATPEIAPSSAPSRAELAPLPRREPAPRNPRRSDDDYGALVVANAPTVEAPRPRVTPAPAAAPAQAPAPAAPTTPAYFPPAAAERNQAGWLSNLLAAASREEPRPAQRAGGDSLEALSGDIARLVDNDAAIELWERWRAGETGAISRRLYTSAGQQTFDDIRRRYRAEPAFRDSVNRYVQEFERLLAKIGQSDRDGAQARTAILSDSGKVYIMLAHAAGRLG